MLVSIRDREPSEVASVIQSDRWDISMAATHVGYPASKLQTDNLGDYARAWGQRQSHTAIEVVYPFAGTEDITIDYVSVLGINRDMPTPPPTADIEFLANQARLIIDYYPMSAYVLEVIPTDFSTTNLVGDYSILNQVLNPPEESIAGGYTPQALTATNDTLNTSLSVKMSNNPNRPLSGQQELLIHVRDSVDSGVFPTITVTLIEPISYEDIEETSEGFIYRYLFDADDLSSTTDPAQISITGSTTGTSTVEFMSIVMRASVVGTIGDPILFDSGWDTLISSNAVTWLPRITFAPGAFNIIVQFSDFSSRSLNLTTNPLGDPVGTWTYTPLSEAFHAGRFVAGEGIEIPLLEIGGFNVRKTGNNQNALASSYGGHLRSARNDQTRWEADFQVTPQSQARVFGELDELFRNIGFTIPCLYIPDEENLSTVLWGILTSWDMPDAGLMLGKDFSTDSEVTDDRFDFRFSIMEASATLTRRSS